MGKLLLESLEIQNFRGFRHLQIEKLGRVNLIVGKNNIGKTAVLEALELYARRGSPNLIWQFLRLCNELIEPEHENRNEEIEELLGALKYLFYGMAEILDESIPIRIGPINVPEETLMLSLNWFVEEPDHQEGLSRWILLQPEEYLTVDNPVPRLNIEFGYQKVDYPLHRSGHIIRVIDAKMQRIKSVFLRANDFKNNEVISWWDAITLTNLKEEVINALRIIAPGVTDLSFVGHSNARYPYLPVPHIKIEDIDEPLPLGNLGDGMFHILGIVLALANAKDGFLLIDEVENGIHYSVQRDLWELIFRLALRLNVQVFATTHSWDCLEGLQKAAAKEQHEEGMLIRLSLKNDDEIKVTLFDERRMGIAAQSRIEIR